MNKFLFWQRWLLIVGIFVTLFGLAMATLNGTFIFKLFNNLIDPVFWGAEEPAHTSMDFQRWAYGAWGATVTGWGIFLLFIAYHPIRNREKWSRDCLATGLAIWFVIDTTISLNYAVYFNAIFNALLLILVALPLGFTWEMFEKG